MKYVIDAYRRLVIQLMIQTVIWMYTMSYRFLPHLAPSRKLNSEKQPSLNTCRHASDRAPVMTENVTKTDLATASWYQPE